MYLKLRIQYDGTGFTGSQLQAEGTGRTVQGELEKALSRLAGGAHIRVALAGRTDTGVHALAQVASLHFPERERLDTPTAVQRALNALLPNDLSVASAEVAPEGFHARFSARKRAYRYLFWNAEAPNPLLSRYSLHVRQKLDWEAMSLAAARLVGTHDMGAFAGSGMGVPGDDTEERPSTVRTMYIAKLAALPREASFWKWDAPGAIGSEIEGKLLALDLVANAFLPQMVRTIVGTLLEVGQGKRTVEDINNILESRDRRLAGPTAKPHGLCLLWVEY
ncbi:MAG TPA: tRNA pseudouridine(38-40) synthase TruA [Chloroflexia bacterium]|nr:tRNA pseudouridine(38-40) synthase TruA [Chloroflexia bacterium]